MNFVLTRMSRMDKEETHCHVDSRAMTEEHMAEKIFINGIKTATTLKIREKKNKINKKVVK